MKILQNTSLFFTISIIFFENKTKFSKLILKFEIFFEKNEVFLNICFKKKSGQCQQLETISCFQLLTLARFFFDENFTKHFTFFHYFNNFFVKIKQNLKN